MLNRVKSPLPDEIERIAETVIGCAIEVHRRLGPGLLEGLHHDAMVIELQTAGLSIRREVPISLTYRDQALRPHRLDVVVEGCIVLELKAVERLDRIHQAQLLSYLRATGIRLGLLMNFNCEHLKAGLRRVIL